MSKKHIGGLILLAVGLATCIGGVEFLKLLFSVRFFAVGLVVACLPLGLAALILLQCEKSDVMADTSAVVSGCLWGLLLGTALTAGLLKLLTSDRAHPYDAAAFVIIMITSLLLAFAMWVVDYIRNAENLSWKRFLLQTAIAVSLMLPATMPAYSIMVFFERILSRFVS